MFGSDCSKNSKVDSSQNVQNVLFDMFFLFFINLFINYDGQ